ncbi:hypothetical protein HAX54_018587 [Datura stramonium]|uniref:Uncharacterized protein n=1 Tax=Datura stramonium TaxID=4076 RepID=A0ABS8S1V2_DATST|nr:hypothetical protein [Datura stramonium]
MARWKHLDLPPDNFLKDATKDTLMDYDEPNRQVTPIDGITQSRNPTKLIQWIVGRSSAPMVFHCPQKSGIGGATFVTLMLEDGLKIVNPNQKEIKVQCRK